MLRLEVTFRVTLSVASSISMVGKGRGIVVAVEVEAVQVHLHELADAGHKRRCGCYWPASDLSHVSSTSGGREGVPSEFGPRHPQPVMLKDRNRINSGGCSRRKTPGRPTAGSDILEVGAGIPSCPGVDPSAKRLTASQTICCLQWSPSGRADITWAFRSSASHCRPLCAGRTGGKSKTGRNAPALTLTEGAENFPDSSR